MEIIAALESAIRLQVHDVREMRGRFSDEEVVLTRQRFSLTNEPY